MTKRNIIVGLLLFSLLVAGIGPAACARVSEEGENVFITDQTGERWDVTQAETLGFKPHRFQYGIGRHAFTPLGDEDLSGDNTFVSSNTRVIGVVNQNEAHAYSVRKLSRHEIANTSIGGAPIAVGC